MTFRGKCDDRNVLNNEAFKQPMTFTPLASVLHFLLFLATGLSSGAQEAPFRALLEVHESSQVRTTVLPANAGWLPIFSQQVDLQEGDLLRISSQIQLTVDSAPLIGQQVRLVVDGQQAGAQAIEINTQPGSHHLPMFVSTLFTAPKDGPVVVTLEGSAFHNEGDFPVSVDHADNLSYGSLVIEQYRNYSDLMSVWQDGALLLLDVHQAEPLRQEVWSLAPYVQEALASLVISSRTGDILIPRAQSLATNSNGLEQFTGVLTRNGKAVSPYGGQNVAQENTLAPLFTDGLVRATSDEESFLEFRIYGAFGHGLTLVPDATTFEVSQFSSYGSVLKEAYQQPITTTQFPANSGWNEVLVQEFDLEQGDLLQLYANLQFARPIGSQPALVECQLQLDVSGPGRPVTKFSQKRINAQKTVLPLNSFLTYRADVAGRYRVALKSFGQSDQSPVKMLLDGPNSQLQSLHFGSAR